MVRSKRLLMGIEANGLCSRSLRFPRVILVVIDWMVSLHRFASAPTTHRVSIFTQGVTKVSLLQLKLKIRAVLHFWGTKKQG